jgi:threonine synthase
MVIDAVRARGGSAAAVSDEEIFAGIDLLAETEGILTEPAGGTTVAVLKKLAASGQLDSDAVVVAMITGNGLKTLDDHPAKPWPSMVSCEPEVMLSVLESFQQAPTSGQHLPV